MAVRRTILWAARCRDAHRRADQSLFGIVQGGTDVELRSECAAGLVRLIVADNGPGIAPGEREKLFMPYYSTKRRGSGLGLAIVRRIVAEHGGTIEVGDNVPKGTKFTIELPC